MIKTVVSMRLFTSPAAKYCPSLDIAKQVSVFKGAYACFFHAIDELDVIVFENELPPPL
jgi:hypothetical protein